LINKAETAPILILDDLGAEKISDWVREQLYIIINRRYENMLPTIVTTNCTTAELVERLGERTVSRLIEMTDAYKITTDDYRLKKG
jgi:DNA replication protein DnaC